MTKHLDGDIPKQLDLPLALMMMGDESSMQQVLTIAEQTLKDDMVRIRESFRVGDAVAANRILHSWKGHFALFCRAPLTESIWRFERLSKTAGVQEIEVEFQTVAADVEQLIHELGVYLRGLEPEQT